MTQIHQPSDQQTDSKLSPKSYQRQHSLWFWPLLIGGSAIIHLFLMHWVGAATLQARLQPKTEAVTPIDFVSLPTESKAPRLPVAAFPSQSTALNRASVSSQTSPAVQHSTENSIAPPQIAAAYIQKRVGQVKQVELPAQHVARSSPTEATHAGSSSLPEPSQSPQSPNPKATATPASVTPSPVAPAPLITTQKIDVPVPDVSGTSAAMEVSTPSPFPPQVAQRLITPKYLVANLTTETAPISNPLIDEMAYPKTKIQTFSTVSTLSCPVKPEVIQFLGKTVVMEVGTDVKGKVVNTVMQESSHSLAYDELAICLVKHWGFEPAIAQSEPVANDGLIVRITIDRG